MFGRINAISQRFGDELERAFGVVTFMLNRDALLAQLDNTFRVVSIETTNICNANCTFCAYQYQTRSTGVMDFELFKKAIDQYCELGGGVLGLTPTVGEPLVDPLIVERIRYARSKAEIGPIGMTSNLIRLEQITPSALIDAGLTDLDVSTTGFDPEMYLRVYRSKMYPKVLRNIIDFAKENNKRGRPVRFRVAMRIDRPFSEIAGSSDYMEVAELVGNENIGANFSFDNWGGKISQQNLTGTMRLRGGSIGESWLNIVRNPRISPCTMLYGGPQVFWDGKVGGCGCRDVNASELIIGNINDRHIGDIVLGEEIKQLRRSFLNGSTPNICQKCTLYSNVSSLYCRLNKPLLDDMVNRIPRLATRSRTGD